MNNASGLPGNVLLIAGTADDVPRVLSYLREAGINTEANPDLYVRSHRQFGVDDAQELRSRASTRAIGDRRVFVIGASGITSEAQNALLKTLEEPPANALFVFVVPAPETLLATVRSRSQIIELPQTGSHRQDLRHDSVDASSFLAAAPAIRIDMLKPILEKDDDDKYDTGAILAFLASLEKTAARMMDLRNPSSTKEALDSIYRARMYVTDRGALVKTLLESVALTAPRL